MRIVNALWLNKWYIVLAVVAAFLFYWFQVRPISTYRSCVRQASIDARKLVASKLELAKDRKQIEYYQGLKDKNMYLRADYDSFLTKCMLYYGLNPVSVSTDESSAASSVSN